MLTDDASSFLLDEDEDGLDRPIIVICDWPHTTSVPTSIILGIGYKLSVHAKVLYTCLIAMSNLRCALASTFNTRNLARLVGCSVGTIVKAKRELVHANIISITKSETGGDLFRLLNVKSDNEDVKNYLESFIERSPDEHPILVERSRGEHQFSGDGVHEMNTGMLPEIAVSVERSPDEQQDAENVNNAVPVYTSDLDSSFSTENIIQTKKEKESLTAKEKQKKLRDLVFTKDDIEIIYRTYPRKVGRAKAVDAIKKALLNDISKRKDLPLPPADWLLERVEKFAMSPKATAGRMCPHPATWFNQARYDDDDKEWTIDVTDTYSQSGNGRLNSTALLTYAEAMEDWSRRGSPAPFDRYYEVIKREGEKPQFRKIA